MGTKKIWCVAADIPRERWELRRMQQDRAIAVSGSRSAWEEYKSLANDSPIWRFGRLKAKQITVSYGFYRKHVLYGACKIGGWSLFNSQQCPNRLKV